MKKKTKDAYLAGIFGVMAGAIFAVVAMNSSNLASQIVWVFAVIFGGLGIGCFVQPDFFGPLLNKIMDNIRKNNEGTSQTQYQPKKSPMTNIRGKNNKVTIKY